MNCRRFFVYRSYIWISVFWLLTAICLSGCSSDVNEFFNKKTIEIHSKSLIRDMQQIPLIQDVNNPLPEFYLAEPKIMTVGPEDTKLYYFTRNHTPDKLKSLIVSQLGYKVDQLPATNQLIIKCPSEKDAQIALDFLQQVDVPPIQVRVDCLISELFADSTMDWETSLQIDDILGQGTLGSNKIGDVIASLTGAGTDNIAFPGASARDTGRSSSGLKIGFNSDNNFNAVIDVLASRGYLKIVMNPILRTVNGKTAKIETKDFVPITKTVTGRDVNPYDITEYQPVTDSLEVTPQVYADGSIGLTTRAKISSKSTPEGAGQKTIITEREIIVEENRIRPGDSLIIGGIRKSEDLGIIRGVPGLQDLPIIGVFFSSKDAEERVKEILFVLTPSISHTGTDYTKMIEDIRKKHTKPKLEKGFVQQMIDPYGTEAYTDHLEWQTERAEAELVKVEEEIVVAEAQFEEAEAKAEKAIVEKTEAVAKAKEEGQAKVKAEAAKTEAEKATVKAEARADAETEAKTKAEAEKAEAVKARTQAEAEKVAAEKAQAQAEAKAAAEAEAKAKAEAEKAEAEKAKVQAETRAQAATEQAQAEAEKAKAEAEKARADAERARSEAEKARLEADKARAQAEAEAKAKAEAEKARADAEAKAKAEAEKKADTADANSPAE